LNTGKSLGDLYRELIRTRANLTLIRVSVEAACDRLGVPDVAPFIMAEISSTLREIEAAERADVSGAPRRSTRRDAESARRQLVGLDATIERNFSKLEGRHSQRSSPAAIRPADIKPLVKAVAARGARRLVYDFLSLPQQARDSIIRELGLVSAEDDRSVPDLKYYESIFDRARERGLLDRLTELVNEATAAPSEGPNL